MPISALMADISIFNPEVKKSRDGFSMPAAGESLFQKRIEFHLAKKPLSPYTSNGGDFHLETLNPSSSDVQRSGLCLGGPSVGAGKRSDHAVDLFEHGLDTELSFGITFRRIGAGLANLGNTCFLNSVLQCLTYTEPFAAYLQSGKHQSSCRTAGFCALCAIQNHVRDALQSTGKILSPKHLVKNLRCISRNFQNAKQEDAHEYMVNLLESMHKCCLPSGVLSESPGAYEKSLVHRIFGGRLRSQVKCTQCSFCSNKFDPFLDLSLEIVKADSLSKALAHFTAVEQLDGGERQYQCQRCKEKVKALKQLTIHKPPNVLTIHLKRFGSHVPGQKINKKVNFGPTLDLKPFASDPHEGDLKYTLYGVLVHAGWSTHSGHYYCFVRTSTGMWYSLDDNQVVQVSERAVLEQKAYMLFYIRDRRRSTPRKPLDIVRKDNMVVNTSGKKEIPVSVLLCSKQTIQNGGKEGRLISSKCSSIARTDTFTSQDKSVPAVGTSSKDPISKEVSAVQAGDLGMAEGLRQSTTSEDPRLDRSSRNSKAKEPSLRDPSVLRNATEDSLTENSYKTAFRLHDTTVATEVSMISPGNLQCSPSCNSNGSSINSVVLIASQNHNKEFQKFSVTVPVAGNGMLEKVDTGSVKASINSPRTSVHDPEAENIEVKKLSNRSSVANGVLVKNYSQCGDLLNDRRSADTLCQPTRENDKKPNETISVKLSSQFGSVSSSLQNEALDATPAKLKPKKHLRFPTVMSIHRGSKHLFLASLNLRKRKKHKRGKWRRNQDMRKLTQKALMGEFVSSDQGPSTSGKARAVDHDRNHGQDQRSHSVSNNGKNNEVAKDMTDHDSGSLHRKERSLSERSGPNSIMLATNELSEKSSSSMAKQCDVRETNGQGKSVSAQHGLMRMLTRGLEEVTVARWDGIELPDAECHGLIDNRKSSIGYVLDERDEEYDRGKRKKVRKSTQPFGGPNPFQEFATETAQVKKMKMMGWNNSGRNPFRI